MFFPLLCVLNEVKCQMRILTDVVSISTSFHLHHEIKSGEKAFDAGRIKKMKYENTGYVEHHENLPPYFWQEKMETIKLKGSGYGYKENVIEIRGMLL